MPTYTSKNGLQIVRILKLLYIESSGYRNMPFDALISRYPETGVLLYKLTLSPVHTVYT